MADTVSPATRSRIMASIKSRDTGPELAVRAMLRAMGIRYRLGGMGLPGRPDMVITGARTAVFVDGCFWHGCRCRGRRVPDTNSAFWAEKIRCNRLRDRRARSALRSMGWSVVVVRECSLRRPGSASARLRRALSGEGRSTV